MKRIIWFFLIIIIIAIALSYSYFGRKAIYHEIEDMCSPKLRFIHNRFYRHAIRSKAEFPDTLQWCDKMIADSEKEVLICFGRGGGGC